MIFVAQNADFSANNLKKVSLNTIDDVSDSTIQLRNLYLADGHELSDDAVIAIDTLKNYVNNNLNGKVDVMIIPALVANKTWSMDNYTTQQSYTVYDILTNESYTIYGYGLINNSEGLSTSSGWGNGASLLKYSTFGEEFSVVYGGYVKSYITNSRFIYGHRLNTQTVFVNGNLEFNTMGAGIDSSSIVFSSLYNTKIANALSVTKSSVKLLDNGILNEQEGMIDFSSTSIYPLNYYHPDTHWFNSFFAVLPTYALTETEMIEFTNYATDILSLLDIKEQYKFTLTEKTPATLYIINETLGHTYIITTGHVTFSYNNKIESGTYKLTMNGYTLSATDNSGNILDVDMININKDTVINLTYTVNT